MRMRGRLPGDERVRVQLVRPEEYRAPRPPRQRRPLPPALVLIYGFAAMIALGTLLLVLPISSAAGTWTPLLDALFTSTSAVCVTGLVVVNTGTYWSDFGHVVILLLIQAGGFGFMTSSTLLLLLVVRRRTRLRDRVLVQETIGRGELGDVTGLVKRVALFTLLLEAVGAVILAAGFYGEGQLGPSEAGWYGLFHSVSAFNNAGFDLMGALGHDSLRGQVGNFAVLGVIGVLIVFGGLGYAIVEDVLRNRRWQRLALETKVVVLTTVALILTGALTIALVEWDNPRTLGVLRPEQRAFNALFESVTLRTAGYSALDTAALLQPSLFVVMALMFIGGASGSTAGGIKVNTFSVLLIAILSTALGRPSAEAFGRRIQHVVVYRALTVALLSIALLFLLGFWLEVFSEAAFTDVLFETVSALATVGASRGITGSLPDPAHLLLIAAMFVGRLGPLTLVLALTARARPVAYRPAVESIRIG
ncbi:MAG TPA: potassium transporter TrkG [Candidatus Caenarcaniphilales bacterium]|nr:potassium transporter TrkG [Candidatus Caenarcaniphilales bacterium]